MATKKTGESELDRILREAGSLPSVDDQVEEQGAAEAESESQVSELAKGFKDVIEKGSASERFEFFAQHFARSYYGLKRMRGSLDSAWNRIKELETEVAELKRKAEGK